MWTSQKDSGSQFSPTQPSPSFPVFPCSRVMTLNGPGLVLHPSLLGSAFSHMIRSRPMGKTQNSVGPLFLMEIDYWLGTTTEMFEGRQTEGEKEQERNWGLNKECLKRVTQQAHIGWTGIEKERDHNLPTSPMELAGCLRSCLHPFLPSVLSFLFSLFKKNTFAYLSLQFFSIFFLSFPFILIFLPLINCVLLVQNKFV